ncbi:hypothetical protein MA785_000783 [Vibrio parahaemolyticus]|nr:hypothetical protein [Vibrio parahaemolyticus]EJR2787892.1 hypothetical protein [Vibrio parahaemolyticus]
MKDLTEENDLIDKINFALVALHMELNNKEKRLFNYLIPNNKHYHIRMYKHDIAEIRIKIELLDKELSKLSKLSEL